MKKIVSPSIVLLLLALPGCVPSSGPYPSLAQRPAESRGFAEPAVPPPAPVAVDPALDARIGEARRTLATIVTGFDRDAAIARAAASRSGARTAGSDAWLDAQTALAALDDWRAQASSLATDVDALASARAAALQPIYPTLAALREEVGAAVTRQDDTIRQLSASLPGG
ncbi:hypothetical protein [Sphingomonas rubra]|uniref:Uncharacterized protein n=1 Tax=Sphingomonas rubra TaxID=634430 RepID=A0A1I5RUK3_9SPHN|nr:hypothetical protein [Sphingomonas rubra]SFP62215.1 hypothetical protein SAMN04488241_104135 [Sphingomonas rubra]